MQERRLLRNKDSSLQVTKSFTWRWLSNLEFACAWELGVECWMFANNQQNNEITIQTSTTFATNLINCTFNRSKGYQHRKENYRSLKFRFRYSLTLLILTVGNRNFRHATNTSKLIRKDQPSASASASDFRAFVITPLNKHYGSGPSTLGQYHEASIVILTCDAAVGIASGRLARSPAGGTHWVG